MRHILRITAVGALALPETRDRAVDG